MESLNQTRVQILYIEVMSVQMVVLLGVEGSEEAIREPSNRQIIRYAEN